MADEKKPAIADIKTFSAKIQTENLESALKKFQGRRTISTVQAARRIAGATREIKIPRNLLKQLFRLTGGFQQENFIIINKSSKEDLLRSDYKNVAIKIGDLDVVFQKDSSGRLRTNNGPRVWLFFRGVLVASDPNTWDKKLWLEERRVGGAVDSLGVEFTLPPK